MGSLDVRNNEVGLELLRRAQYGPIPIDNPGTAIGHQVPRAPCDIRTHHLHAVLDRARDVSVPGVGHKLGSAL